MLTRRHKLKFAIAVIKCINLGFKKKQKPTLLLYSVI